jgi:hypothetical protein
VEGDLSGALPLGGAAAGPAACLPELEKQTA